MFTGIETIGKKPNALLVDEYSSCAFKWGKRVSMKLGLVLSWRNNSCAQVLVSAMMSFLSTGAAPYRCNPER